MTDTKLVTSWETLREASDLTDREKHVIAKIINTTSWDYVVWLPDWLVDDKDFEHHEDMYRLAVGEIEDYSSKAWLFWQPHHRETRGTASTFLPKSQATVFEVLQGCEITSPTHELSSFSGGDA